MFGQRFDYSGGRQLLRGVRSQGDGSPRRLAFRLAGIGTPAMCTVRIYI